MSPDRPAGPAAQGICLGRRSGTSSGGGDEPPVLRSSHGSGPCSRPPDSSWRWRQSAAQAPGDRRHRPIRWAIRCSTAERVREDAFFNTPLQPGPQVRRHRRAEDESVRPRTRRDFPKGPRAASLFWGRNVGSWATPTQDWVEAFFRKFGLQDVHRKRFDLPPQWTAKSAGISFSSGGKQFTLKTARPAEMRRRRRRRARVRPGVGRHRHGGGLRGARRQGQGRADSEHPDAGRPAPLDHRRRRRAARPRRGAAAVGMIYGISDNFALWELRTQGRPGFCVGYEDGRVILERIGKGEKVKVKIALESAGPSRPPACWARCPAPPTRTSSSSRTWMPSSTAPSTTDRAWR